MKIFALAVFAASGLAACAPLPPAAPLGTSRLDHDVQRLWDDAFNPGRGDERTEWERRREYDRREWCRANSEYGRCGPYR